MVDMSIACELVEYFAGFDVGQMTDPAALAILERRRVWYRRIDPVSAEQVTEETMDVRYLHRWPLGTAYGVLVDDVAELLKRHELAGRVTLLLDGTGVGAPVAELLRKRVSAPMVSIVITAGENERSIDAGNVRVPKRNLVASCVLAFEGGELRIASTLPDATALTKELLNFRMKLTAAGNESYAAAGRGHDDLVLAVALALWWARRSRVKGGPQPYPVVFGV